LDVIRSISTARVEYVVLSLILVPFFVLLGSYQLKILTTKQGLSISLIKIFEISFVAGFYGTFLPGNLSGGAIRWYKLSRVDKKPIEALVSVLYNRLIDSIMLVSLGIIFWKLDKPPNSEHLGYILLFLLFGLIIIQFLSFNRGVSNKLIKYLNDIPIIPSIILEKIKKVLRSTSQYHGLKIKSLCLLSGISLIKHFVGVATIYFFALSLGINISFINLGWVRTFLTVITELPISFSGLGVREGTLIYLLGLYNVIPTEAVALSFLLMTRKLLIMGIGGLIEAKTILS
jgi:uncharacterized protein (TIRG00374 family)